MSIIRLLAMALGTIGCAMGFGFFVQNGETAEAAGIDAVQMAIIEPVIAPIVEPEQPLDIQGITLISAVPDSSAPRRLVAPRPEMPGQPRSSAAILMQPDLADTACGVTATATPAPMASVDLSVLAPCFGNERVTVHHNGMMFSSATDEMGKLSLTIPVLTTNAVFIVAFGNGKGTVAMARVPDLANYGRVVLQWTGESAFQIHAREFGADYGTAGHVWIGMQNLPTSDQRGTVIRLGDASGLSPRLAEIYTFPIGASDRSGVVSLSIETEVTANNCGKDVMAQAFELGANTRLRTRDLTLSVADCSAIGDFLVLNNLVDDMTIAAN